jgi:hypothetical protein
MIARQRLLYRLACAKGFATIRAKEKAMAKRLSSALVAAVALALAPATVQAAVPSQIAAILTAYKTGNPSVIAATLKSTNGPALNAELAGLSSKQLTGLFGSANASEITYILAKDPTFFADALKTNNLTTISKQLAFDKASVRNGDLLKSLFPASPM